MPTIDKNSVFDNWNEYQIRILFSGWENKTVWQFALSCVCVFTMCLSLNMLYLLKDYVKTFIYSKHSRQNEERAELIRESLGLDREKEKYDKCCNCAKFSYFLVSILYYTNLFIVTLCATTFNPWILLSIVLGYSSGDLIIFHKKMVFDFDKYS